MNFVVRFSKMFFKIVIFLFILNKCCGQFNFVLYDELKEKFLREHCIELSALTTTPENLEWMTIVDDLPYNDYSEVNQIESDKSVLQEVQEIVQYNDLKYHYELLKEEGSPNSKIFTVALYLANEKYLGTGSSLKKAQREAAKSALEQTAYDHPPTKERSEYLTPTVKLNNIATKLAYPVQYFLVNGNSIKDITNVAIDEKIAKSYFQKLNDSIFNSTSFKIPNAEDSTKGPFNVQVRVGNHEFLGFGYTIQLARHDAAINAIKGLKDMALHDNPCLIEGKEVQCKSARDQLKSPVSLVYEAAQQRNMEAIFEIIEEYGKPHKKTFITEVRIGTISARGKGQSKKDSKRAAAEEMLKRFHELPNITDESLIVNGLRTKSQKKKKKNKIIKTNVEKVEFLINDLYQNFIGGGETKFKKSEVDDDHKTDDGDLNDADDKQSKTKSTILRQSKTAFQALLQLSNYLKFNVQLNQMKNNAINLSLIQLTLKPIYICYGEDVSEKLSKEKAALAGLIFLYKKGFSDLTKTSYPEIEKFISLEESKVDFYQMKNIDKDEL